MTASAIVGLLRGECNAYSLNFHAMRVAHRLYAVHHDGVSESGSADDEPLGRVLSRPARDTFGTLLHEAVHGLAWARKTQDTSRQGRYHNKEYKARAEQVGLTVEKDRLHGWTITKITDETCELYADALALLEAAVENGRLRIRRHVGDGCGISAAPLATDWEAQRAMESG